ncbi:uncharacterized protein LOC125239562 [Leguminivora glycinivorella]|uniref:uncharacterized protein LOC125239562 n=1 Tax=Leguminivora glycinivorella TaxID=1035111 RepID=UPI00200DBA96|nr:uncharacterized protein LOC125239562 [Leguminivora glycinivorella]
MNEQKSKKISGIHQHPSGAPLRRVSFSKPSKISKSPSSWQTSGPAYDAVAISKLAPMPRDVPLSRPSKSSLKNPTHNKTIGVSTRNKNSDATSSTTVDSRRRLHDPTPSHLKYGTFRRVSHPRQYPEDPLLSPRCESKPIVVARSSFIKTPHKKRPTSPNQSLKTDRSSVKPPGCTTPPPIQRPMRRVHLSQTVPIHIDIKPKKFPSMMWC